MPQEITTAFLFVHEENMSQELLNQLRNKISAVPGTTQITICCTTKDRYYAFIDTNCQVNMTFELLKELQDLLGEKNVKLNAKVFRNDPKPKRFFKKDEKPAEKN